MSLALRLASLLRSSRGIWKAGGSYGTVFILFLLQLLCSKCGFGVCSESVKFAFFLSYGGREGWAPAAYLRKMQDGVMPGNQATESNKPAVEGQVEIIGNLMEISNLLNKKPAGERHTQNNTNAHRHSDTSVHSKTDTYTQYNGDSEQIDEFINNTHSDRDTAGFSTGAKMSCSGSVRESGDQIGSSCSPHTDSNVCLSVSDTSVCVSVSDASVSVIRSEASVCSATPSTLKTKTVPPSPAIARVAPQRVHSVETSE